MRLNPCRDGIYSSFWPSKRVIPFKKHLMIVSGIVFSGMLIQIFIPRPAYIMGGLFTIIDPIVKSS